MKLHVGMFNQWQYKNSDKPVKLIVLRKTGDLMERCSASVFQIWGRRESHFVQNLKVGPWKSFGSEGQSKFSRPSPKSPKINRQIRWSQYHLYLYVGWVCAWARLACGAEGCLGVGGQTLNVPGVTSVMPLGLRLGAVEDSEAGHVVDNLPGREAVEVGPGVLAAVAINPLQTGVNIWSWGLQNIFFMWISSA